MSAKRRPLTGQYEADFPLPKRPRADQNPCDVERGQDLNSYSTQSHADYTIAWICALHLELAASRLMFDEEHPSLPAYEEDRNVYVLGRIAQHNVVMTALPVVYGKVNAALVATHLKRTFPNIRATLMVGIGGGAPNQADLYLGDVVVGTRVMEYDLGKAKGDGQFEITPSDKHPSPLLRGAFTSLRSKHGLDRWSPRAQEVLRTQLPQYCRPTQPDRLFQASYQHPKDNEDCDHCDQTKLQTRRQRLNENFFIHYGGVASGDSVNKDVSKRDTVARKLDIICFEMEAAGIMDSLQCLPIRGICDYSDSHKNKKWQHYAAATAASYAKELLETIPVVSISRVPSSFNISSVSHDDSGHAPVAIDRKQTLLELIDFPQSNTRKDTIRAEQGKTCRWFLTHPKYLFWADLTRDTESGSLLWLRGKAGAGKSTLLKFLFLDSKKKQKDATVVSFFFNARGDTLEKTIAGMYRSILWQMLTLLPDLQSVLDDFEIIPANRELVCPDLVALKTLLNNAVLRLGNRPLLCFIDALDECDEDDARDMVEYFENLIDEAQTEGINVRVVFSSRPYPYIHMEERYRVTLENEAGHGQDLAQYVKKCLKIPARPRVELEQTILEKASGVFMWVVLVVGILNKEAGRGGLALRKRLSEIPPTLSQLFKDILTRDQERPEELRRCVLWILCARRPLTSGEFCHAMWVGGLATGDVDNEIPDAADEESNAILATSSSKGLIEVVPIKKKQAIVQFIHESVRDYLVKDKGLQELWPDIGFDWEGISHELLRNDCEAYLDHCLIPLAKSPFTSAVNDAKSSDNDNEIAQGSGDDAAIEGPAEQSFPDPPLDDTHLPNANASLVLAEYATQNILHHANQAALSTPQEDFLVRFFDKWDSATLDVYQPVKKRRFGNYATPLQMLAALGTDHLVRLYCEKMESISDSHHHTRWHPLMIAMANGHRNTAAALLGIPSMVHEGIDLMMTAQGETDVKGFYRMSPMTWAAGENRCALMTLLAKNGASMLKEDNVRSTPLQRAEQHGQLRALRVLVDGGVSSSDVSWHMAVFLALIHGRETAVVAFLQDFESWRKVPAGQISGSGDWLESSAFCGSEEVVRLLLRQGTNPNGSGSTIDNPIAAAASEGHGQIVELLADHGADLNRTRYGKTALMCASQRGHLGIAQFLIHRGADLHLRNSEGKSALDLALEKGNEDIAQLLRQEIDIEAYHASCRSLQ